MLSDIMALSIAHYAMVLSKRKKPSKQFTFGWQRAETIGALINSTFLLALCFTIIVSAIQRFVEPVSIREPFVVLGVGCAGLAVNGLGLFLFHDHNHSSDSPNTLPANVQAHAHSKLNMRAVFLHVLGDALGSVGVIISAIVIKWSNWEQSYYMDPAISILIALIIIFSTVPLFKKTAIIVLHIVPPSIKIDTLQDEIMQLDHVHDIHEFHVWQLSDMKTIASVHIIINDPIIRENDNHMKIVEKIKDILHGHGIHSTTVQIEMPKTFNGVHNNIQADEHNGENIIIEIADEGRPPIRPDICLVKCTSYAVCEPQTCCSNENDR